MKDVNLYRQLAADGNKDAQNILDTGNTPDEEFGAELTDSQEIKNQQAIEEQVLALDTKAAAHALTRDYARSADAHFERGEILESQDNHLEAMDAYKRAARALFRHGADHGLLDKDTTPNLLAAQEEAVIE